MAGAECERKCDGEERLQPIGAERARGLLQRRGDRLQSVARGEHDEGQDDRHVSDHQQEKALREAEQPERESWSALCQALFASAEFQYRR